MGINPIKMNVCLHSTTSLAIALDKFWKSMNHFVLWVSLAAQDYWRCIYEGMILQMMSTLMKMTSQLVKYDTIHNGRAKPSKLFRGEIDSIV